MKCAAVILGSVVLLVIGVTAAQAGTKVEVCHIPPHNPDNFHTITINESAFSAHLAHGDLAGACNAVCATLCDDENACTIDDTGDCEQHGCPSIPEPVDCNDGNECTADSCDPIDACVNTPLTGEACDDGQVCTGPLDTCDSTGTCTGDPIWNCCLDDNACSQNPCDGAECDLDTNRCIESPIECVATDVCMASACAPETGSCIETPVVCTEEGATCNPTTGSCEVVCPCVGETWEWEFGPITWDSSYAVDDCYYVRPGLLVMKTIIPGPLYSSVTYMVVDGSEESVPFSPVPVCGFSPWPGIDFDSWSGRIIRGAQVEACYESIIQIAAEDGITCD